MINNKHNIAKGDKVYILSTHRKGIVTRINQYTTSVDCIERSNHSFIVSTKEVIPLSVYRYQQLDKLL